MVFIGKIKKGLSALLNLDGILSVLSKSSLVASATGAYIVTLLDWFEYLPQVFQVLVIINAFAGVFISIRLMHWSFQQYKKWSETNHYKDLITKSKISLGIRQHLIPELKNDKYRMCVLNIYDGECGFAVPVIGYPYFEGRIAYLKKCVITSYNDFPLFKVLLPITINYYDFKESDKRLYTFAEEEPDSTIELNISLSLPLESKGSYTFWINNECERNIELIFHGTFMHKLKTTPT